MSAQRDKAEVAGIRVEFVNERAQARLGSVLVSFIPVRGRSPAVTRIVFAQAADGGGRR